MSTTDENARIVGASRCLGNEAWTAPEMVEAEMSRLRLQIDDEAKRCAYRQLSEIPTVLWPFTRSIYGPLTEFTIDDPSVRSNQRTVYFEQTVVVKVPVTEYQFECFKQMLAATGEDESVLEAPWWLIESDDA